MSDFEFFLTFFGLILGLTVAEVAIKFADAVDFHPRRPIGLLSPLLAIFVLMDITSFWLWAWGARDLIEVSWTSVYTALAIALCYFLAASLVFPRNDSDVASLDQHFWRRKRLVLGGVLLANAILIGLALLHVRPSFGDSWFFVWQGAYFIPLAALWVSRSRAVNLAILVYLPIFYAASASGLLPNSEWGVQSGLKATAASTSEVPGSR
jgi:hypothetical protein